MSITSTEEEHRMKNNDMMTVLVQGFYGNRTVTSFHPEKFDPMLLGYLDMKVFEKSHDEVQIDRTIIRVPDTENLVLVYNRYSEEERLKELQIFIQKIHENKFRFNPTVVIPEMGIVLYSRCFVCRINEDGELISLKEEDCPKVMKYLTA